MLRPMKSKLIVKPIPRIKSEVIQVIMDEKPNTGIVVAVGTLAATKGLEAGQTVRFGTMGREAKDEYLSFPRWEDSEGQEHLILDWQDVVFIEETHRDAA